MMLHLLLHVPQAITCSTSKFHPLQLNTYYTGNYRRHRPCMTCPTCHHAPQAIKCSIGLLHAPQPITCSTCNFGLQVPFQNPQAITCSTELLHAPLPITCSTGCTLSYMPFHNPQAIKCWCEPTKIHLFFSLRIVLASCHRTGPTWPSYI